MTGEFKRRARARSFKQLLNRRRALWYSRQAPSSLRFLSPEKILKRLMRMIEANSSDIIDEWLNRFGEIRYFC